MYSLHQLTKMDNAESSSQTSVILTENSMDSVSIESVILPR